MPQQFDFNNWLEYYLAGELTEEDWAVIDKKIQEDPEFARNFALDLALLKESEKVDEQIIKPKIVPLPSKSTQNPVSGIWRRKAFLWAACLIGLLSLCGYFIYHMYMKKTVQEKTNANKLPAVDNSRKKDTPSVSTPILLTQTDSSQPSPLSGNEDAVGRSVSKKLTIWSNQLQIALSESIADLQNAGQNANYADLLIVGKQVEALRVLKEQTTFTPAEHFYLGSLILFYEVPTHTNTMTAIEHLKAAEGYREVLETRYIILAFLRLNKVSEAQKVHRANSDVALPNEILILLK